MPVFAWDPSLSVDIMDIDEDHKQLISLINALYEAMKTGQGKSVLTETLNELVDYTKNHFASEESLMTKYKYPEYIVHKRQHDEFVKKALELKTKNDSGENVVTVGVMNILKDWLKNHIKGTDKKYTGFFNSHGIN